MGNGTTTQKTKNGINKIKGDYIMKTIDLGAELYYIKWIKISGETYINKSYNEDKATGQGVKQD